MTEIFKAAHTAVVALVVTGYISHGALKTSFLHPNDLNISNMRPSLGLLCFCFLNSLFFFYKQGASLRS